VTKQDAQAMLDSVSLKAKTLGLQFNYDILQATSTLEAHRLTRLVPNPIQAQLNLSLYKAYFTQGLNLADTATLIKLSHDLGVDALEVEQQLNSNQGLKEVLEELQQAKQLGIKGVPYYRINQHTVINGAQPLQSFIEILKEAYLKEVQKYNRE